MDLRSQELSEYCGVRRHVYEMNSETLHNQLRQQKYCLDPFLGMTKAVPKKKITSLKSSTMAAVKVFENFYFN